MVNRNKIKPQCRKISFPNSITGDLMHAIPKLINFMEKMTLSLTNKTSGNSADPSPWQKNLTSSSH